MLIAFTLAVAALVGSWFTSLTKTETDVIESSAKEQINCSAGILDIVEVVCKNSTEELKIAIQNMGTIGLYDFSIVAKINNTFYVNSTVGPNSTTQLKPGQQYVLVYYCNSTYCPGDDDVRTVRVSPGNCPQAWAEQDVKVTCAP